MRKLVFQQGDVLLYRVNNIPKGEKIDSQNNEYILAEGEVTGHKHKIVANNFVTMIKADNGQVYLQLKIPTPLKHDEHHIIIIEPGKYEVGKVRERDHFERITREIID
jgi:hypothetical protein